MQDALFELTPQKNQTIEHWWLAWAARLYLLAAGAVCAGMEVCFWEHRPLFPDEHELSTYTTQVGYRSDVVGIMRRYNASSRRAMPIITDAGRELVTVAVEAKASRADFKRGFDDHTAHFNYLVCPAGMVKPCELPRHVGLLVCHADVIMARRAQYINEPRLSVDDALRVIAASNAREVRRMTPTTENPFAGAQGS